MKTLSLDILCDENTVEFRTKRCRNASVLWVNKEWFLDIGIDVDDVPEFEKTCNSLINDFGVLSVKSSLEWPAFNFSDEEVSLDADRYSNAFGADHGGSGRCGTKGILNAKGIGVTPLVSEVVDISHRDGSFSLEEAIREAVVSDLVNAEIQNGAIPIVAIIDLGLKKTISEPDKWSNRRAVVVRPNFIRLGHLSRSIYFGSSGIRDSDQFLDSIRCKKNILDIWGKNHKREVLGVSSKNLLDSALRTSSQAAYCCFYRLWHGPFYSSNSTIDGHLFDFGSFRSLSTWERFVGDLNKSGFGEEVPAITASFLKMAKSLRKSGLSVPTDEKLGTAIAARYSRVFKSEVIRSLNLQNVSDKATQVASLAELVYKLFMGEQNKTIHADSFMNKFGFLGERVTDDNNLLKFDQSNSEETDIALSEFRAKLKEIHTHDRYDGVGYNLSLVTLRRFFHRRKLLEREFAIWRNRRFLERSYRSSNSKKILLGEYIRRTVSCSRRIWPDLPKSYEVVAQTYFMPSASLICRNAYTGDYTLWIEAKRLGGLVFFKDSKLIDLSLHEDLSKSEEHFRCLLDLGKISCPKLLIGREFTFGKQKFCIPCMDFWY